MTPKPHEFTQRPDMPWPTCIYCGVVQRRDWKNSPVCRGPAMIVCRGDSKGPMDTKTADALDDIGRAAIRWMARQEEDQL